MSDPRPPDFRITLRALPDTCPGAVRLRRALKCLLRSFGLRAVRVEELSADPRATRAAPAAAASGVGNP